MFLVQQVSRPDAVSGQRQVQIIDAEWDYRNDRLNWDRAVSFLPLWADHIWVRGDGRGNVTIEYGRS